MKVPGGFGNDILTETAEGLIREKGTHPGRNAGPDSWLMELWKEPVPHWERGRQRRGSELTIVITYALFTDREYIYSI